MIIGANNMKKQLFLIGLCLILGAVLVAGCLDGNGPTTEDPYDPPFLSPPERIDPPADTAMYRGNVTNIDAENNTITLAQVRGTNFGAPTMTFTIGENSRMNFEMAYLEEGQYVEVFYGTSTTTDERIIIVANLLQYAALTVWNGEVIEVRSATPTPEQEFTSMGSIKVTLEDGSVKVFNWDDSTQFYINMEDLTEGTKINVLSSWIRTLSEPPQAHAYEIRRFSA